MIGGNGGVSESSQIRMQAHGRVMVRGMVKNMVRNLVRNIFRSIVFSFLVGVVFSFAYWQGGVAAMFIAGGFGVVVLHVVLMYLASNGHYEVRMAYDQEDYVAGEDVSVTLTLEQRRGLPLFWLVVEQVWVNETRGSQRTYRQLVVPLFRRIFKTTYKVSGVQRGVHRCPHIKLYTGDVFGLFGREKTIVLYGANDMDGVSEISASFVVYPQPLTIAPHIAHELYGSVMSSRPTWLDTQQFNSIRDYANGDPLNRIHWKSSARMNELKTRENEKREDIKVLVMLDTSRASYAAKQPISSFEKCVQVTASFMHLTHQQGIEGNLICSNDWNFRREAHDPHDQHDPHNPHAPLDPHDQHDPRDNRVTHFAMSLEEANALLARVRAEGEVPFSKVVLHEVERIAANTANTMMAANTMNTMNTMLFCVTAQLDDQLYDALYHLRSRGIRVGLLLVHSTVTLAWHEQYLKERLLAMDCLFYSVQHTQLERRPNGNEVMGDVS